MKEGNSKIKQLKLEVVERKTRKGSKENMVKENFFSNRIKGWNSTKSELSLILNKNKVGLVQNNIQ